jgi:putrescine aminotransferase
MEQPMKKTDTLRRIDSMHHIHPFTDNKAMAESGGTRIIARSDGIYLYDSDDKRYLDGMAGLWCVAVGYGRKELADTARNQMIDLSYYNSFLKTTTPPSIELAKTIADLTPPGLDHVFFANSGSEANDTIVRMIRRYWHLEGKPERRIIISREFAYHGSTVVASSLGGMAAMHDQAGLLPEFEHILPPYWYKNGGSMSHDEFGLFAAQALEEKILEIGPDKVAAFFAEPVQGAGAVIVPPDSYWPKIQEICHKYDVLLVADEVITGFGRTGPWFGCETYGIKPDFITLAKAITSGYIPLSAAVVGERVAGRLIRDGGPLMHGFTYTGHPTACAVALENIRILKEEGIVDRVSTTGPLLQKRLHEEFDDHPFVGEVRGVGLMAALEFTKDKEKHTLFDPPNVAGSACFEHCLSQGLIIRGIRDCVAISPPLTINEEQIEELIAMLKKGVDLAAEDFF